MKLIFFGTSGAVQTAQDVNVSFCIIYNESSILVETSGNPINYLLKSGINPVKLDAVVISHSHTDHIYALPSLIHNLWLLGRKEPLYILSNRQTIEIAKNMCGNLSLFKKKNIFPIEWIEGNNNIIRIGDGRIKLFPVNHPVETSGFSFQLNDTRIVYSADTSPIKKVIDESNGADALIHEGTAPSTEEKNLNRDGHSSFRQAGEVAEQAGVKSLFICHFDGRIPLDHADIVSEVQKHYRGLIIIPELFKTYNLNN